MSIAATECTICYETFSASAAVFRTECFHFFHIKCLYRYVEYLRANLEFVCHGCLNAPRRPPLCSLSSALTIYNIFRRAACLMHIFHVAAGGDGAKLARITLDVSGTPTGPTTLPSHNTNFVSRLSVPSNRYHCFVNRIFFLLRLGVFTCQGTFDV